MEHLPKCLYFEFPFAASLQGRAGAPTNSNSTKLTDLWQSQTDFCDAIGGPSDDGLPCYAGSPVALNNTQTPTPPSGMCLEKIGNGSYLNMVGHPDGSSRAFFSNQQGKIWLATIPKQGSGGILEIDEANPFLDLTDEVHFDTEFGMLGIAFHPKCACNSDVNCDPSKLGPDNGAQPCQFQSVIAEFTVNGTASQPASATSANPSEVRRIFTMGLPFTPHHGGQILLDREMGATEVDRLGLWGNYSIPKDNPYTVDKNLQKEIWALGLRNPWRCSFDSARPSYFICADVGQITAFQGHLFRISFLCPQFQYETEGTGDFCPKVVVNIQQDIYEEVDLITKHGNYGWRAYEGRYLFTPRQSPGGNTSVGSIRPIFPVMGYNHSEVNSNEGSASITGGYFYRSMTDPCMIGRYLFADLYAGSIWAGTENPITSGKFTSSKISFNCADDSPINCTFTPGSSLPALSYIFSFGEDNNKDVYLLTNSGVYRIVSPSRCNYTCSKVNASTAASPGPAVSPPPSEASLLRGSFQILLVLNSFFSCISSHSESPRHHRPPPEISNYEETIIIDSVFPLEETIDFVRRGPRHYSSREITAAMSRPVRRGPRDPPAFWLLSHIFWTSTFHAPASEEEETMILGGIEDDEGVLMSGPLSQEIITRCLKTRNSCPDDEQEDKVCAICLDDFGQENGHEMIGVLDCRHEYHAG
ncbi:hypothetical protein DH2020_042800 [Rehmannia glutinosa]|uniref:Glucose/Sorbosone dehydrogenase domain-containing protein n=1 Tax=Rehmannia glutinosa TaxID=99300 RepID=A0ABR0ULF7_REHGL